MVLHRYALDLPLMPWRSVNGSAAHGATAAVLPDALQQDHPAKVHCTADAAPALTVSIAMSACQWAALAAKLLLHYLSWPVCKSRTVKDGKLCKDGQSCVAC